MAPYFPQLNFPLLSYLFFISILILLSISRFFRSQLEKPSSACGHGLSSSHSTPKTAHKNRFSHLIIRSSNSIGTGLFSRSWRAIALDLLHACLLQCVLKAVHRKRKRKRKSDPQHRDTSPALGSSADPMESRNQFTIFCNRHETTANTWRQKESNPFHNLFPIPSWHAGCQTVRCSPGSLPHRATSESFRSSHAHALQPFLLHHSFPTEFICFKCL